jgi:hypothetical protein
MGDQPARGDAPPPCIVLYGRPSCHLCDVAKPIVLAAAADLGVEVVQRNVEDEAAWEAHFGSQVPVAFVGPVKLFKYRVDRAKLEARLARCLGAS